MRQKINIALYIFAAFLIGACEPQEYDKTDIGSSPAASSLKFTVTQVDDFNFKLVNTSEITGIPTWDLGNGTKASGNEVNAYYPLPGTYTIALTLATKGGTASVNQEQVQAKTDYSIFTDPVYVNLTGGVDAVDGKTWVVDSLYKGHYGIGPADGTTPEWWSADALGKTNTGSYDDEFTFNINGFIFECQNNGDSYAKEYRSGDPNYTVLGNPGGEADVLIGYTPPAATWSLSEVDGANVITLISDFPQFFGFDYGATNNTYRIESVTENELRLSCIGGDGNRWYNILIPKGYERPSEPDPEPDPKELQAVDIKDDFEGNGNVTWNTADIETFATIDNFYPRPANTSSKIQFYEKGAFEWTNVSATLAHRLDLSTRNVFK